MFVPFAVCLCAYSVRLKSLPVLLFSSVVRIVGRRRCSCRCCCTKVRLCLVFLICTAHDGPTQSWANAQLLCASRQPMEAAAPTAHIRPVALAMAGRVKFASRTKPTIIVAVLPSDCLSICLRLVPWLALFSAPKASLSRLAWPGLLSVHTCRFERANLAIQIAARRNQERPLETEFVYRKQTMLSNHCWLCEFVSNTVR